MRVINRRVHSRVFKRIISCLFLGIGIVLLFVSVRTYLSFTESTGLTVRNILKLIFVDGADIRQSDNRTNVLLMGVGGGSHEGPDLTDTMLVLSIDKKNRIMSYISIPRDIWSDTLRDKINSAYHYGELKKQGGGLTLAKVSIEDIIGIPIHYALVINFSNFTDIINTIGGIDVYVSETFSDTQYPIDGKENDDCNGDSTYACRYMTVRFEKGVEHMNGSRALIYVRSRHASGSEGNDFSRNRRQQEVLSAIKEKVTRFSQIIQIRSNIALFRAIDDALTTDATIGELLTIGRISTRIDAKSTSRISIESLFFVPEDSLYGGRYVLVPTESYTSVHAFIQSELSH